MDHSLWLNKYPKNVQNAYCEEITAMILGLVTDLLSFQGIIALRDSFVATLKPGLLTWVREHPLLTDALWEMHSTPLTGLSYISFCFCNWRSCSASHGWSPLSSWSSCSLWFWGHRMMWVKQKQWCAPCGAVFFSCEHQFALARGVHSTFGFCYRLISAVWSNPSSQATKTLTQWCTHVQQSLTSLKQR